MKNYLIMTCLTLGSLTAIAFQTPTQQSAQTINAVIQSILSDKGLQLLAITKVTVNTSSAKAQLINQRGECLAIPYVVKADAVGTVSVEIDKAALAICD